MENRSFWRRGHYVITIGENKQSVEKFIQNQEKEDVSLVLNGTVVLSDCSDSLKE